MMRPSAARNRPPGAVSGEVRVARPKCRGG
jgi:hypothetical protein